MADRIAIAAKSLVTHSIREACESSSPSAASFKLQTLQFDAYRKRGNATLSFFIAAARMEALNGPSLKSAKGAFKMTVKARAMLVLIGIGLSTCVSPAYAAEYSDSPDQSTTGDIKADIFVENFAWVSNTIYLWANHVAIDKPEEDFCDPADPDPDCKDPLGRGYTVDSSYLNLNQSHTFKIDRSRLYLGDITLEAELVVSTPSQADCTQTTQATSYIYIVSTDSFEQCTANTHVRYLRQYFYLNAAYPGKQALNNLDDFTIYNEIEEHGTVFYAYWKLD